MKKAKNKKEQNNNKKIIILIIIIVTVVVAMFAGTYAYWQLNKEQTDVNKLIASCLDFRLENENDNNPAITLNNQWPILDADGINSQTGYKFVVTNNCDTNLEYHVGLESIDNNSNNFLNYSNIKVMIDNEKPRLYGNLQDLDDYIDDTTNYTIRDTKKLTTNILAANSSRTHTLKLWLDNETPISEQGKEFVGKIVVSGGSKILQDSKTKILAAIDISKTEQCDFGTICLEKYYCNCHDVTGNDVKATLYSDGDLIISGYGEMFDLGKVNEDSDVNRTIVTYLLEDYANRYLTENERMVLEDDELSKAIQTMIYDGYETLSRFFGTTVSSIDDVIGVMSYMGYDETVIDLTESILNKIENDNLIKGIKNIIVEDGVTSIGDRVLSFLVSHSITMADSVVSIGEKAFINSEFDMISLPPNLVHYGSENMFYAPEVDLVFPNTIQDSELLITCDLNSVTLPKNTRIKIANFSAGDKLNKVYIPSNIETIKFHPGLDLSNVELYLEGPQREIQLYHSLGDNVISEFKNVYWNQTW